MTPNLLSTQSSTNEKHRLECLTAKFASSASACSWAATLHDDSECGGIQNQEPKTVPLGEVWQAGFFSSLISTRSFRRFLPQSPFHCLHQPVMPRSGGDRPFQHPIHLRVPGPPNRPDSFGQIPSFE